jgi:hypothetical protein
MPGRYIVYGSGVTTPSSLTSELEEFTAQLDVPASLPLREEPTASIG